MKTCLTKVLFLLAALPVNAASIEMSANNIKGNRQFGWAMDYSLSNVAGDSVYSSYSDEFVSVDGLHTTTYEGEASASAYYNALHASVRAQVSNTFYDPDFEFMEDHTVGVPQSLAAVAVAEFSQNLLYGGFAMPYYSTFRLRLTGSVDGGTSGAYAMVEMSHGTDPLRRWFFDSSNADENGNFELFIDSTFYNNAPNMEFSLRIYTQMNVNMEGYDDGSTVSGFADFGNTLEVVGVDVRDELGNPISGATVTSDSGQVFDIIQIPEPSSLVMAFGFVVLGLRRSRRAA